MLAPLTLCLLLLGVSQSRAFADAVELRGLLHAGDTLRARYAGMTEKEVVDLNGPPSSKRGDVWRYSHLSPGFHMHIRATELTFRDGCVMQVRERCTPVGCMTVEPRGK
jgi:hypothetical protein